MKQHDWRDWQFGNRRLATFAGEDLRSGALVVKARNHTGQNQPNLCVRFHNIQGRAYAEDQLVMRKRSD
jgi:hypothetical protein